ncbi:MAG: hypothetical protein WDO24_23155 [Pseudomonadota bacterium]
MTQTNSDGTTTITTTYADGRTTTMTEPSPRSSLVTKDITTTNAHGTTSNTITYADGTTKTTIEASHSATARSVLDPYNAAQWNVLLAVQESPRPV